MTLNAIMSQATTGLLAAQTGLRAVSDNIANVNTPGYVRKIVEQTPLVSAGMGVGVDIAQVRRAADQFLQKAVFNASAASSEAGVVADMLNRAQGLFGDPTGDTSFFTRLDEIFAAFSSAADDPASSIRRAQAVSNVEDFLSESSRIGASLRQMIAETDSRIAGRVDRANELLKQIDALNADITRARVTTQDSTGSENIQQQLINELAGLMDITVTERAQGGVSIRAPDGAMLAGDGAATLKYVRADSASGEIQVTQAGSQSVQSLRLRSGELRGLLDLRDQELPGVNEQLAEFVSRAVDELNRAHNAASAVPPPTSLTGRNTGLDLPTAVGGFTGQTTIAIVGPDGQLQREVGINFDSGVFTINGGAGPAFTPATFLSSLNAALGGFGTASFSNGALTVSAAGGAGIAIQDDPANPSTKAGKGFSHFFGLNDLVTSSGIASYETGLRTTDQHGFTTPSTISFRVAAEDGTRVRDVTVDVPPGGTVGDLVNSLNANIGGLGLYGQFSLDADGAMSFRPNAGSGFSLTVLNDETERGAGGPSVSELFGLGAAQRASRAERFSVREDIAADPKLLAMATLDLSQDALGRPVLSAGDGRGGVGLANAGDRTASFDAAGGISAIAMTISQYAAEFGGFVGRRADAAEGRRETAQAVAAEAEARRASQEGVNLDQELISLTTYQQAFNASARLVQATRDMYDVLIGMMG